MLAGAGVDHTHMDKRGLTGRITSHPNVLRGQPTIRGTRITVAEIVEALADGVDADELLVKYPKLKAEDIIAALMHAAEQDT